MRLTAAAADRATQRRHAQGSGEPADLSLFARVSGRTTPSDTWPWACRRWAAAAGPRPTTSARWRWPSNRCGGRRCCPSAQPAAGVEPKTPAPLAEKSQLGARLAGRQWVTTRRIAAAARLRSAIDDRQGQAPARAGRQRHQHPRRPAGQRPALVAHRGRADLARGPDRADPAFLLPRSELDRHAGRPAGLRRLRRAEHPVRHRRPAETGRLSARHRRVRRRFDRHGGRAAAAELAASTWAARPSIRPPSP